MLHKINIIILFVSFNIGFSQNTTIFFNETSSFLKKYVTNGSVDYINIKKHPEKLKEILQIAENITISEKDTATYKAFWINAYNLSVIKGVIDNYPIKSPLDKAGFFDKINYKIGDKSVTLNTIENTLLRAKFKDTRFHFVLVCGAIGCPPLINTAYLPKTLDVQLNKQTHLALNGSFLKLNTKKKQVIGSEILKWYKEDFTMNGTSEIDFINKYRTEKIPTDFTLHYFSYNWNLNKK